jgi:signal transduction histidine kinase/DNA-binding response OmpR family regulator
MSKKILIVDDEPDIVKIFQIILEMEPGEYISETAGDGREALLKVPLFLPDLIILDEMLPFVSGNEVAKLLKTDPEYKQIPIIMVTAKHQYKDKIESLVNSQVDDYVTKPFEPEEIRARIKAMLRLRNLTDELKQANDNLHKMYKQASDMADIRKKLLDEVLKGSPSAVILTDNDMNIIEANANLYDVLSLNPENIIGKKVEDIFKVDIKSGEKTTPYAIQFFDNLKGKLYLDVLCHPMTGYDRNIIFVTDNTREKMLKNIRGLFKSTLKEGSDNKDFLKNLLSEIKSYFFAEAGALYMFDGENTYKGEIGEPASRDKFTEDSLKINIGQLKKSMHSKVMCVTGTDIKKYMADPENHMLNFIIIPLKGIEKKLGILLLYNCPGIEISFDYKIEIIDFIVNIVSVLYENMLLISRLNKENILVRSLINISQIINSTIEYNKLISVFVEIVSQFMGAKTVGLFLFNKTTHNLELIHSTGYDAKLINDYKLDFITKEEIESGGKDVVAALKSNKKFSILNIPGETHIFALKMRYKLIGYVVVYKKDPDIMYTEMLALLMEHVAKAIENSYLFDQIIKQNEQLINTTDTLAKTEQKLIISEQLAGMGRFAAAVAHEIRNPLTIMLGAVQNSRNATPEEKNIILEHLEAKIIDIDHILRQMMEFAKQIKITIEEFDPVKSLDDTLNFISGKAKIERVEIIRKINIKSKIKADKMWLERVLLNLFINALDEMKDGGVMTVTVGEDFENIIFKINDTGKGIPNEIKNKIFEPFNTSKKAGTGLGLYNVKKTVELQGGRINFITGDTGTTFTIQLPKVINK